MKVQPVNLVLPERPPDRIGCRYCAGTDVGNNMRDVICNLFFIERILCMVDGMRLICVKAAISEGWMLTRYW